MSTGPDIRPRRATQRGRAAGPATSLAVSVTLILAPCLAPAAGLALGAAATPSIAGPRDRDAPHLPRDRSARGPADRRGDDRRDRTAETPLPDWRNGTAGARSYGRGRDGYDGARVDTPRTDSPRSDSPRSDSLGADWRPRPDEARRGVREGRLAPLGRVIDQIRRRSPGRQLDAGLETDLEGRRVYRVRWAGADGRRSDYIVDAETGRVLGIDGR